MTTSVQVIHEAERRRLTTLSRVQWWRLEKEGQVPKRVPLSKNRVGWLLHEIQTWIEERAAKRQ